MAISEHVFADHMMNVSVTGTLIRIELGALQLPVAEGQKPQLVLSQTLVMPLDGFVNSFGMLESVIKKLVENGVVTKQTTHSALAPV